MSLIQLFQNLQSIQIEIAEQQLAVKTAYVKSNARVADMHSRLLKLAEKRYLRVYVQIILITIPVIVLDEDWQYICNVLPYKLWNHGLVTEFNTLTKHPKFLEVSSNKSFSKWREISS